MSEVGMLELLLSYAIPRRDVRPLAEDLLERFGGLRAVLEAAPGDLKRVRGIKDSSAALLNLAGRLAGGGQISDADSEQGGSRLSGASSTAPKKASDAPARAPSVPPPAPAREAPKPGARRGRSERGAQPTGPSGPAKSPDPKKAPASSSPKLQISNGYLLEPAQNAQILSFVAEKPQATRITRKELVEGTGFSNRQIESSVSMITALGLMVPQKQLLTPLGRLVVKHDLFFDSPVTLEYCHFTAAGNPRNLVWFLVFNELLAESHPPARPDWNEWIRTKLAGRYTERTLRKHVSEEVRFVIDAYMAKNFAKLGLLLAGPDEQITLRHYMDLHPLVLAAVIYRIGWGNPARLVSFSALHGDPGSPGRVFGLDAPAMREMAEVLHRQGWVRFEIRHGLDQLRLLDGYGPLDFLEAAYEGRPPEPSARTPDRHDQPMLL